MSDTNNTSRQAHRQEERQRSERLHPIWLALVILVAYTASLPGDFLVPDRVALHQGADLVQSIQDFKDALTTSEAYYRNRTDPYPDRVDEHTWQPLALFDLTQAWLVMGDCAFCFHFQNLFWHFLVTLALLQIGRRVLKHRRRGQLMAFWTAVLFALHPANVSVVAAIAGRHELVGIALGLWALVLFLELPPSAESQPVKLWPRLAGTTILFGMALATYSASWILLLIALMLAWFELAERGEQRFSALPGPRKLGLGLLATIFILYTAWRLLIVVDLDQSPGYADDKIWNNIGTSLRLFWAYVSASIIPSEPVASDSWLVSSGIGSTEITALFALLAALGGIIYGLFKWHHPLAMAGAWLVLWLLPNIAILPREQLYTEQVMYPTVWGGILIVVFLFTLATKSVLRLIPKGDIAVFAPVAFVLFFMTALSNVRWLDDESLYQTEANQDPSYLLGRQYLAKKALEERDYPRVVDLTQETITNSQRGLYGAWSEYQVQTYLAEALFKRGEPREAERIISQQIDKTPKDPKALLLRMRIRLRLNDLDGANEDLLSAVKVTPNHSPTLLEIGEAALGSGGLQVAGTAFSKALRHDADNKTALVGLAETNIQGNNYGSAEPLLQRALKQGDDLRVQANLALVYWRTGRRDQGRELMSRVLTHESDDEDIKRIALILGFKSND